MIILSDSVSLDVVDGVGICTVDNPPVNALSQSVREGLSAGVDRCIKDPDIKAIVLMCSGKTFIAGADIKELAGQMSGPSMHDVRKCLDSSMKPVIAAIHGSALGGGLETALSCHFRVADKSSRLGLPEVNLGLLPGGGGTQRLPRLVGVNAALQMMVSGEVLPANRALEMGLVDEVVSGDLRSEAVAFAKRILSEGRPLIPARDRVDKLDSLGLDSENFETFRKSVQKKIRGFDAPDLIIECVEAAVTLPFDLGIEKEKELFSELLNGPQSKALRHLFLSERAAMKVSGVSPDTPIRPIKKVGVIGAGVMGGGVSQCVWQILHCP